MALCPPAHRTFSDERGPGTFHTLGVLPMRHTDRKPHVFHIHHGDDDDHASSPDELVASPDKLLPRPSPPIVPFPRTTSPLSSPASRSTSPASRSTSPRPILSRGASTPILLSNGKPLKSSLKSSSSSPTVLIPTQTQHLHLRARSEPSTPAAVHKNVHFPEADYALATVRVYNRSARPAALSSPVNGNGNGDETETDGDETPPRFPFPPLSPAFSYEIDPTKSTPIPSKMSPPANLLLESLSLPSFTTPSSTAKPLLTGSILVRNLAFEKHVAIRFTLDDWQTVSEVGAHYVDSLSLPPSHVTPSPSASTSADTPRGRGWDRFTFSIRLEDYAHALSTRTLWLAARYRTSSTYPEPPSTAYGPGGEWWDNNDGRNYRVGFRPAFTTPAPLRSRPRRETVSAAPISSPRIQLQPPVTCKEHALGIVVPSTPDKEAQPLNETDRRSTPLRAGKLSLFNYSPPTHRSTPSVLFPSKGSPQSLSPSSITNSELPSSATLRPPSDEDSASPASSTLSTPSVSPTIPPRVLINGHPATLTHPNGSGEEDIIKSGLGRIGDWDWSAPNKSRTEGLPRQHTNLVPDTDAPERRRDIPSPPGRKALSESNSLYDAFVMQWCFAQGPSPSHNGYDDGGIMA